MTHEPDFIGGPIWTHGKRGDDVLMAGVREFKGSRFVDIRCWTQGGKTATAKGVTMPLDAARSFASALMKWAGSTDSEGLQSNP